LTDDVLLRVAQQLPIPDLKALRATDRRLRGIGAQAVKKLTIKRPEDLAAALRTFQLGGLDEISLEGPDFTDAHLAQLPGNLKKLTLEDNQKVTDAAIARFESLESLSIARCSKLTGAGWEGLTLLKRLNAERSGMTDASVSALPSLEDLNVMECLGPVIN
jgi:hypothetical protein